MELYNKISLTHFAATVADLAGIEAPACAAPRLDWVCDAMKDLSKEGFDRVLIYNPDAVGMWLAQSYPDVFEAVLKHTQLTIPFLSPMPSVTPVCFGTMYTGAEPAVHGIQAYEKKLITIDTLFDAARRAGKKVALLATPTCSMGTIFQERDIDYYLCASEWEIMAQAQALILEDSYDIICVYTFMFDTENHRHGPYSPEAQMALARQCTFFDMLASSVRRFWKDHNTLITFSPDHGVHEVDPPGSELNSKGKPVKGHHGSDRPQDLNILHFFGAVPRAND